MLVMLSPNFMANIQKIFGHNFVKNVIKCFCDNQFDYALFI